MLNNTNKNNNKKYEPTLNCIQPEEIYSTDVKKFINYDEKYKAKFPAVENLSSNIKFSFETLSNIKNEIEILNNKISFQRESLKNLNSDILEKQENNIKIITKTIQDFSERFKRELYDNKNETYHFVRETQHITREKLQLQQQINFSTKRIEHLEKTVGISKKK